VSTSTHPVAVFEEGFILVSVTEDDIIEHGAPDLWELVQNHEWILEQEIPVVIVYETSSGMQAYGDEDLVESVTSMNFEEIVWGHELELEW
jgi:hypothetical protein